MDYDPTSSVSGCFEERPGWIQFNINLMDKGVVGKSGGIVDRKDNPINIMRWIENN